MKLFKYVYSVCIRVSKLFSRKGIYPFLNKEFSEIKANKKVLTIGSGGEINTLLYSYANQNSFQVTSFDISEKRQPDIIGDICTYDFENCKFDIIVIAEVLEHLHTPQIAIANIKSILNNGGKLILTVPFIFPIHDKPYDYYRYTKYGLEFLFKDFTGVSITERNSLIEAINVLFIRLINEKELKAKLLSPIILLIACINLPFIYIFSKFIKTDFITTGYLLTARKD